MFVQFCSQNLPSFEPFWGFFGLDPHWVLEEQASSCLLSLSLPPSPNSRIVCLSVCLLSLDCPSSDCVLCACFETEFCVLDFLIFIGLCVWLDFGDREEGRKEGRKEENWACFVGGRILLQQLEFLVISRFFAACF
jgi:hypothetical protein